MASDDLGEHFFNIQGGMFWESGVSLLFWGVALNIVDK
jgi:hypothetical protein